MRELIRRRGTREPLQHIVGSTSFAGLEMAVNRHVLIPRPETELLAERAAQFLAGAAGGGSPAALDFGTGSGCLAIYLAVKCPAARITACDISAEALQVAGQNAAAHGVAERIAFRHGDGLAALPPGAKYDLIVSNPPYLRRADVPTLEPEVREYDPPAALVGGEDGLEFHRLLAGGCPALLQPGGRLMLEFADGQSPALAEVLKKQNWIVEAVERDYSRTERFLIARQ